MLVKFGTIEYYKMYADAMNKDEAFQKAALSTNFMYVFSDVLGPDGQPKAFLLTIENGKVTASEAKAADLGSKQTEFGTTATYAMHAGIAKGEINAQKAKLKLNMMKAMKHQKSLGRLSEVSKTLPGVEY